MNTADNNGKESTQGTFSKVAKAALKVIAGVIGFFVLFGVLIWSSQYWFGSTPTAAIQPQGDKTSAYTMMQSFVEDRLKTPGTAKYPMDWPDHVKIMPDNQYKVSSWVDAQNEYGAVVRKHYIGIIEKANQTEWRLVSLTFN